MPYLILNTYLKFNKTGEYISSIQKENTNEYSKRFKGFKQGSR